MTDRILTAIAGQAWAILPANLEQIVEIASRIQDDKDAAAAIRERRVDALETVRGERLETAPSVRVRDGVAVVPVLGPIFPRGNMLAEISGATTAQGLAYSLNAAKREPGVRAIVLNLDSPGGAVTGIHELAQLVRSMRDEIPVVAYASGTMASAAYWIGSAASEIVIDATSVVGSIGAVMSYRKGDDGGTGKIVSSNAPNKQLSPETEDGRAQYQEMLDDMEAVFLADVAKNRGITVEAVLASYGMGSTMVGQRAVDAGLADRLGSLESLIAELGGKPGANRRQSTMTMQSSGPSVGAELEPTAEATDQVQGVEALETETEIEAAAEGDLETGAEIVVADPEASEPTGESAIEAAVGAERARVLALIDAAPEALSAELSSAIETGASAGDFALALVRAQKERGVSLAAIAADATGAVNAPAANVDQNEAERQSVVSGIAAGIRRRRK